MSKLTKEWLLQSLSDLEKERNLAPGLQNYSAANAFDALSLALAALEANGGWIKCSDLMPSPMHTVLVTGDWFDYSVSAWSGKEWINFDYEPPVTHWMPLPATPLQMTEDFATKVQAALSRDGGEPKK